MFKKIITTVFLGGMSLSVIAIEVRPMDDSSMFCDNVDCIASIKYMDKMSQMANANRAIIEGYAKENRELRAKLARQEYAPLDMMTPDWTRKNLNELWMVNDSLAKRNNTLEDKCGINAELIK